MMITQMQRLLNCNIEEIYGRIEGLENQLNQNAGRHYGGNKMMDQGKTKWRGKTKLRE